MNKEKILKNLHNSLSKNVVDFSKNNSSLLEEVAACDEELIEKFLEGSDITSEDIRGLIEAGSLFPAVFGSALKLVNIEELIELIDKYVAEKKI